MPRSFLWGLASNRIRGFKWRWTNKMTSLMCASGQVEGGLLALLEGDVNL